MIITRPDHDVTTNYLYHWSKPLISAAGRRHKVIDLAKKRANASELASIIKKVGPTLIVFNGHGDESTVTGFDNEPLIKAGKNHGILKGSTVYARSCRSAKILGPRCIRSRCRAYLGYDDDFVFFIEEEKITHPLEDKTAKLFLEPSNHVVISLLKGHSAGDSNSRSKELFKRVIQSLATSSAPRESADLVPYLIWDYIHQVCLEEPHTFR